MDYGLFDEASRDLTAEALVRRTAMVRHTVGEEAMPFLALASSEVEYIHRKALMADRLSDIALRTEASLSEVEATADRMYALLSEAKTKVIAGAGAMSCANCQHRSVDHTEGLACQCGCNDFSPQTTASKKEARQVTAEAEGSGPFS